MGNRSNSIKRRGKFAARNKRRLVALATHLRLAEEKKRNSMLHSSLEIKEEKPDDYDLRDRGIEMNENLIAAHMDHTYSVVHHNAKTVDKPEMSYEDIPAEVDGIAAEPKTCTSVKKNNRIFKKKAVTIGTDAEPKTARNKNKRVCKKKVCTTGCHHPQREIASVKKRKYRTMQQEEDQYLIESKSNSHYKNKMSRNDTNDGLIESHEAPELQKFLKAFSNKRKLKYCVVCLRTENERRLTRNVAFNKFASAAKIESYWRNHLICYMCERQATNALKFFKAAAFASAIHKILGYYFNEASNRQLFRKANFRRVLVKLGLGDGHLLPSEWEAALMLTRDRSQLNETEPLVIDNQGVKLQNTLVPNEIYVIPDDPPNPYGHVTGTATRTGSTTIPDRYGTKIQSDGTGNQSDKTTRSDSMELRSSQPQVSETLVILDDEDPLQIQIAKVESEATGQMILRSRIESTLLPELPMNSINPLLPMTPSITNTPKLVPIEKLLEKPIEKLPDDPLLVTRSSDSNFILHPIVMNGGLLTVPTLAASIIDGHLVFQPDSTTTPSIENKMLKDLIQQPAKMLPMPNNIIPQAPTTISKFEQSNVIDEVQKSTKRDSGLNQFAPQSKKSKASPLIQKFASESDKHDRIDWEDKIPMDVISFMDAVDPNRPNLSNSSNVGFVNAVSNAISKTPTPRTYCRPGTVIDLC